MEWHKHPIANKTNLLFVFAILAIWIIAAPGIQFQKVNTIEENFPGASDAWTLKGNSENTLITGNSISITPTNNESSHVYKTYDLSGDDTQANYLKVRANYSGIARLNSTPTINNTGKPTIVYLWFENADQKRLSIQILSRVLDTDKQKDIHAVIAIPETAINVNVGLLFRDFTKGVALERLSIVNIKHTEYYRWAVLFFALLALYLAVKLMRWIWSTGRAVHATLILIIAVVVLLAFILPGRTWMAPVNQWLGALIGSNSSAVVFNFPKYQNYGHFIGFLLFTPIVLSFANASRFGTADVLFKLTLFSVLTEVLQRHTTTRTSNLEDVFINFSGILLGALFWYWLSVVRKRDMTNELA